MFYLLFTGNLKYAAASQAVWECRLELSLDNFSPQYKLGRWTGREIIRTYSNRLELKIIRDTQAILIEGSKVKILDKKQKR